MVRDAEGAAGTPAGVKAGSYVFKCQFCGEDFGSDVVRLALHIKRVHDAARTVECAK